MKTDSTQTDRIESPGDRTGTEKPVNDQLSTPRQSGSDSQQSTPDSAISSGGAQLSPGRSAGGDQLSEPKQNTTSQDAMPTQMTPGSNSTQDSTNTSD